VPADLPLGRDFRHAYHWTSPSWWQPHWTAHCRLCLRYFDVPSDFYESLESTCLLIDHYKAHLDDNRPQESSS
jgi:hypothetical protein